MATLITADDIRNDALVIAGELANSNSDFYSRALDLLNRWHRDILSGATELEKNLGDPWVWAKRQYPAILNIKPKVAETVTLAQYASSGTFAVAPSVSYAGWYLKNSADRSFYRIATHSAAAQAFTLDSQYNGDALSASSIELYKFDYDLEAGILRLVSPMRAYESQTSDQARSGLVEGIDANSMDRDYPVAAVREGTPDRFSVRWHDTDAGIMRVRFNKVPLKVTRLEYEFIPIPADLEAADKPIIPEQHRKVLSLCVAYNLLLEKTDSRKDEAREIAASALQTLANAYRKGKSGTATNYGKLVPRRDMMGSRTRFWAT